MENLERKDVPYVPIGKPRVVIIKVLCNFKLNVDSFFIRKLNIRIKSSLFSYIKNLILYAFTYKLI